MYNYPFCKNTYSKDNLKCYLLCKNRFQDLFKAFFSIIDQGHLDKLVELYLIDPSVLTPARKMKKIRLTVLLILNTKLAKSRHTIYRIRTFDSKFYKNYYADLSDKKLSSWIHFVTFGEGENRRTSPLFDLQFISNQVGESSKISIIDLVLNKRFWHVNPSEYVSYPIFMKSQFTYLRINPIFTMKKAEICRSLMLGRLLKSDAELFKFDDQTQVLKKYLNRVI